MKTLDNTLVDNNFENNLIKKLDFQKFKSKLESFYNVRRSKVFKRDFYLYTQHLLNNRSIEDLAKDVDRTRENIKTRLRLMSFYVDKIKKNYKI
jgi:hypothetical protein